MTEQKIQEIIKAQNEFFATGKTLDVNYRIAALKKLKQCIYRHLDEINAAIKSDLGKDYYETYMCETGLSLSEISYMIKHAKSFSREKRVRTPMAQYVSRSFKKPSPYGTVLIMSPWNYPFLLTIDPLADAIAAGNTVILKPSAYSKETTGIIEKIISECFPPEYVAVITGGRQENTHLLNQKFDYIFFTGSQNVGRQVMAKAAINLTPVSLELGGKSPCIVDESANINLAARRIVFGKFLNCGQTCVAPDYIYCHSSIKDRLIDALKLQIEKQYGRQPLESGGYGKIINEKHFDRILSLIDNEKVIMGNISDRSQLKISPTLMTNVTEDDAVMQEEIFGPILPVLTYDNLSDALNRINHHPKPLALYIFSSNKKNIREVTKTVSFGGGCINDTIIHLATSNMGFGGVGESGMGSYHGKEGFDTFTHYKSIVDKKTFLDLPMRYRPYKKGFFRLIKLFVR